MSTGFRGKIVNRRSELDGVLFEMYGKILSENEKRQVYEGILNGAYPHTILSKLFREYYGVQPSLAEKQFQSDRHFYGEMENKSTDEEDITLEEKELEKLIAEEAGEVDGRTSSGVVYN